MHTGRGAFLELLRVGAVETVTTVQARGFTDGKNGGTTGPVGR